MWNLVPPPGIEPGPPALGARNLSHWATREVPHFHVLCFVLSNFFCLVVLFSWQHQCPGTDFSISAEQATPKVSDLKPQFIPLFQFCGWIGLSWVVLTQLQSVVGWGWSLLKVQLR